MKRVIILVSFLSIFILLSGCGQKAKELTPQVSEEEILARFDDQIITKDELEKEISELPEWRQEKYKDQAGREEYLTLMAESRMILKVAKTKQLDKNPQIIKETQEFQDQIIRDELVKREVDDKVKVTDADIEKYYAEHKSDYIEPERVVVTEITQKDEAKAKEVLEKIKAGADFTELAKEMDKKGESFGPGSGNEGKTRPFSRDSYSAARVFVEKAFSMKPGEISDIIVQPIGDTTYYMVIRLDERIPSRQKELSEVKEEVKSTVERNMKEERRKQWMDQIRKEYKFEIYYDKIPPLATEGSEEQKSEGKAEGETKQEKPIAKPQINEQEVLVKFDGQRITVGEFEKSFSELPAWKQDRHKDKEGRQKYLDELAEEKLLTYVATKMKIHEEPDIAKQINEYRDQLMLKELVKIEVDDKIQVTDADLEKYYSEHKAEYVEPEKVVVTEITVKSEEKAKEILEKIKSGADFTQLAKEMDAKGESFGPGSGNEGKTRPFSRDSYSSARQFVETAFSMQPGQISDIIVQPLGNETYYMIIRVDERMPSRQKELSEVKDDVERSVEREKKKQRLNEWLEALYKEHNLQIYKDRIPKVEQKEQVKETQGAEQKTEETTEQQKEGQK